MRLFTRAASGALISTAACSGLLIPEPTGPYKVALQAFELVDQHRLDPWNATHPRRMMVSRFNPVPNCNQTCTTPYMSKLIADNEDAIFGDFMSSAGLTWPSGVLAELELQVCCDKPPKPCLDGTHREYPVVLFGSGLNTTRLFYSVVAQHIASRGYTVITMDHPYETDVVQFPDGTVVYGGNVGRDLNDTVTMVHALDIRTNDASFVLNTLGIPYVTETDNPQAAQVAMLGQSFGGAAAAAAMLNETRIVAGSNMDGYMFGPVLDAGLGRPGIPQSFVMFGSVGHDLSADEAWSRFLISMREGHPEEWIKELSTNGSVNGSYVDFGVIADVAGWRDDQDEAFIEAFCGEIAGSRMMEVLAAYFDDYLQMTLRGAGEGLLAGPSAEFPEVQFLG